MRWKMCSRLGSQPSTWVEISSCLAGGHRPQVTEMRFGCEVAAGGRAGSRRRRRGRPSSASGVAEHLQVAALVGVAVVVDPLGANRAPGAATSGWDKSSPSAIIRGGRDRPRAPLAPAQNFSSAPTPWRAATATCRPGNRLGTRSSSRRGHLPGDSIGRIGPTSCEQLVGELGHVRQASSMAHFNDFPTWSRNVACRPRRRRSDRSCTVPTTPIAARGRVGSPRRPRPRWPRRRAPATGLAPHRLHQPVGDEPVDLGAHMRGDMPPPYRSSAGRAMGPAPSAPDPHSSTSGSRYMGSKGCATQIRCGFCMSSEIRDGQQARREEVITARAAAAPSAAARQFALDPLPPERSLHQVGVRLCLLSRLDDRQRCPRLGRRHRQPARQRGGRSSIPSTPTAPRGWGRTWSRRAR